MDEAELAGPRGDETRFSYLDNFDGDGAPVEPNEGDFSHIDRKMGNTTPPEPDAEEPEADRSYLNKLPDDPGSQGDFSHIDRKMGNTTPPEPDAEEPLDQTYLNI